MAAGGRGPAAGRGRRGRRARRAALPGVPPVDDSPRHSRGLHPQGPRGKTAVHPLRKPRHGAAAPHRAALLRHVPAAGVRVRRSGTGPPAGAARSVRPQGGRLGGLRAVFGPAGQDLSRRAEPRGGAAAGGALRPGLHPRRRRRRATLRRGDGAHVSQRHGVVRQGRPRRGDGPDRRPRLRGVDGFAGHAPRGARGYARGVGVGSDASRAGIPGLWVRSAGRAASRHGVPSLFGIRQQALPLRRLPLSESRDPRDDRRTGPAACRTRTKRKSLRTTGGSFFAAAAVSRLWCRPFRFPRSSGCICPRRPWRSRPSR